MRSTTRLALLAAALATLVTMAGCHRGYYGYGGGFAYRSTPDLHVRYEVRPHHRHHHHNHGPHHRYRY